MTKPKQPSEKVRRAVKRLRENMRGNPPALPTGMVLHMTGSAAFDPETYDDEQKVADAMAVLLGTSEEAAFALGRIQAFAAKRAFDNMEGSTEDDSGEEEQ